MFLLACDESMTEGAVCLSSSGPSHGTVEGSWTRGLTAEDVSVRKIPLSSICDGGSAPSKAGMNMSSNLTWPDKSLCHMLEWTFWTRNVDAWTDVTAKSPSCFAQSFLKGKYLPT